MIFFGGTCMCDAALGRKPKAELYALAKKYVIPRRSSMTKAALAKAVFSAQRRVVVEFVPKLTRADKTMTASEQAKHGRKIAKWYADLNMGSPTSSLRMVAVRSDKHKIVMEFDVLKNADFDFDIFMDPDEDQNYPLVIGKRTWWVSGYGAKTKVVKRPCFGV